MICFFAAKIIIKNSATKIYKYLSTQIKVLQMRYLLSSHKSPAHRIYLTTLCAASIVLAGCGGGSEKQAQNDTPNPAANAVITFDSVTVTTGSGTSTFDVITKKLEYGAKAHLSDVGVIDGATGEGVSIMVIDDFDEALARTLALPSIQRKLKYREGTSGYVAIYGLSYQVPISFSHGQLVSDIAGGTRPAETLQKNSDKFIPRRP